MMGGKASGGSVEVGCWIQTTWDPAQSCGRAVKFLDLLDLFSSSSLPDSISHRKISPLDHRCYKPRAPANSETGGLQRLLCSYSPFCAVLSKAGSTKA